MGEPKPLPVARWPAREGLKRLGVTVTRADPVCLAADDTFLANPLAFARAAGARLGRFVVGPASGCRLDCFLRSEGEDSPSTG